MAREGAPPSTMILFRPSPGRRVAVTLLALALSLTLGGGCTGDRSATEGETVLRRPLVDADLAQRREIGVLDLGTPGARPHLAEGWTPEDETWGEGHWPSFVWGTGERSVIDFVLDRYDAPRLTLRGRPLDSRAQPPQEVEVLVNERVAGRFALTAGFESHSLDLADDALVAGPNRFELRYHNTPTGIADGNPRRLRVAWDRLELSAGPRPWERKPRFEEGQLHVPPGAVARFFVPIPPGARLVADRIRARGNSFWETPPIEVQVRVELEFPADSHNLYFDPELAKNGLDLDLANPFGQYAEITIEAYPTDGPVDPAVDPGRLAFVFEGLRVEAPFEAPAERVVTECTNCNVLLVSLDTLRPDHLGAYGYDRPTSPEIDRFREDSILFDEAIAHAPNTLNSHASLLTGLLPTQHRASHNLRRPLPEEATTLAELLRQAGRRTAAFTAGGQIDPRFGLGQGFDVYQAESGTRVQEARLDDAVTQGIEWLEQDPERPFFLFLHSYEIHHPYTPRSEILERFDDGYDGPLPDDISVQLLKEINRGDIEVDERDVAHVIATYNAELANADAAFGRLMRYLEERGRYEDTLIVFTSDHGEEFGEHGRIGWHASSVFREQMRIPLIVKLPGERLARHRFDGLARSVDVLPTVLDALGVRPIPQTSGRSLLEAIERREAIPATGISQWDVRGDDARAGWSIRTRRWKLWRGYLFDLAHEPFEQTDVSARHPAIVQRLAEALEEAQAAPELSASVAVEMSEDLESQLQALGYID